MNKNKTMTFTITVVCLILGIIIAVQIKAISASKLDQGEQSKTLEEMRVQLIHEMNSKSSLEEEIKSLNEKIKVLEESSLSQQEDIIKEEYRKAQMLAGLSDVTGTGVVIKIGEDGSKTIGEGRLLQLVNDLRMGRAQAISINDERITAMTAIEMGNYFIVINGNTVAAPYVVKVIGNQENIHAMINAPRGIISSLQEDGWFVSVEEVNEVQIPKIKEDSNSIKTDMLNDNVK